MLSQPRQTRMLARRKRRQPFENVCFWRGRQSRWSHCGLECMLSGARNAGCRSNKKMSRKTCFRSSYVFDPRVCHSVHNMVWCQKLASAGRRIVFALHEVMDHGYQLAQTHTLFIWWRVRVSPWQSMRRFYAEASVHRGTSTRKSACGNY